MIQFPPSLEGTPFSQFRTTVCIWLPEDTAAEDSGQYQPLIEGFHLRSEVGTGQGCMLLDAARNTYGGPGRLAQFHVVFTLRRVEPEPLTELQGDESTVQEIESRLQSILGGPELHDFEFELQYRIGGDALPRHGTVAKMLGLSTVIGEEELVLSGAQLAVAGNLDETITYLLSDGNFVSGTLRSRKSQAAREDFLIAGFGQLKERFERLVMESRSSQSW